MKFNKLLFKIGIGDVYLGTVIIPTYMHYHRLIKRFVKRRIIVPFYQYRRGFIYLIAGFIVYHLVVKTLQDGLYSLLECKKRNLLDTDDTE